MWVYRTAQTVLFIFYKCFFGLRSVGAENYPDDGARGVILAPNHASFLDPPILGVVLKQPITFLAKDYLFKPFVLGYLLRWLGCIPIKSESEDFRSMRQLFRALKDGKGILIFPEGTRTTTGEFKQAEAGVGFLAVRSQSYVLPIYISGTFKAFPKDAKWFKCSPVSIHFGKPFVPALDKEIMSEADPYMAVGRRIMEEIKKIKKEVESH
jgi:1-acyl-sn-glycerol-3-phosphate acyltransferase